MGKNSKNSKSTQPPPAPLRLPTIDGRPISSTSSAFPRSDNNRRLRRIASIHVSQDHTTPSQNTLPRRRRYRSKSNEHSSASSSFSPIFPTFPSSPFSPSFSSPNSPSFFSSPSTSVSTSSDDVFYLYKPENMTKEVDSSKVEYQSKPNESISYLAKNKYTNNKNNNSSTVSTTDNSDNNNNNNNNNYDKFIKNRFKGKYLPRHLTLSNSIRAVAIIVCFALFVYYTCTIFKQYFYYDTLVLLEYSKPNWTRPPAITICTHCVLCMLSGSNRTEASSLRRIGVVDVLRREDLWRRFANESSITVDTKSIIHDTDILCSLVTASKGGRADRISCDSIAPRFVSILEGHKCYTYFSDLRGHMTRRMAQFGSDWIHLRYDYFPKIRLTITGAFILESNAQNSNSNQLDRDKRANKNRTNSVRIFGDRFWINSPFESAAAAAANAIGMFVAVHDPTLTPDMTYVDFRRLTPGHRLVLPFGKRIQRLLAAPYRIRCYEYRDKRDARSPVRVDPRTIVSDDVEDDDDRKYHDQLFNAKNNPLRNQSNLIDRNRSSGDKSSSLLGAYRTQGECYLHCMWRALNAAASCVNYFSSFTEDIVKWTIRSRSSSSASASADSDNFDDRVIPFCDRSPIEFVRYWSAKRRCVAQCPRECRIETYGEESPHELPYSSGKPENLSDTAYVDVIWSSRLITNVRHEPKISVTVFLATLGGHAHIWLGVSLIVIIRRVLIHSNVLVRSMII